MSLKKFSTLVFGAVAMTTVAFAGGVDDVAMAPDAGPDNLTQGAYLELQGGYVYNPWKDTIDQNGTAGTWGNGQGGWVPGLDVGYQWNQYVGAEIGGFYFAQHPKYNPNVAGGYNFYQIQIKQWVGYGALKLMIPIYDQTVLYAKVGMGYDHTRHDDPSGFLWTGGSFTSTHWGPMFAFGISYNFAEGWMIGLQYARFSGITQNTIGQPGVESLNPNLFLVNLGYLFAV